MEISITEAFQTALRHHQAGRLSDAEAVYLHVLQAEPEHVEALHMLGVIARQSQRNDIAIQLIGKAISIQSTAGMHYNLGAALHAQGQLADAVQHYQSAIALKPAFAEAYCHCGVALQAQRDLASAITCYRTALSIKPDYAAAHGNLGVALMAQHQTESAIACYRQALSINPQDAGIYNNLGNALRTQGNFDLAVDSYHHALAIKPDFAEAYANLGLAHQELGDLDTAIAHYRHALTIQPDNAITQNNLGNALKEQHKFDEAAASYRKALAIQPDYVYAHNNLGATLLAQGETDAAIASCRRAIALDPAYAKAHNNLGLALQAQGNPQSAIESYRRALKIDPHHIGAHGNLLCALHSTVDGSPEQRIAEARRYGANLLAQAKPYSTWSVNLTANLQPLRIGVMFGGSTKHSIIRCLDGILPHCNSAKVQLIAYSARQTHDELAKALQPRFGEWHSIDGLNDEAAARKIHNDRIHILIDVAGHAVDNRLPVFAWKPAPVQVTWPGFATSGMPGMDYVLTDKFSVPDAQANQFTEAIWYLPDTQLCLSPPTNDADLDVAPAPMRRNGYITFGCFRPLSALNDQVLATWGKIFHALPHAVLRLQHHQLRSQAAREKLAQRLATVGIAPQRILLLESVSRRADLEAYAEVDILLDTFPHTGSDAMCDALWMGVPTLTIAGNSAAARQGASLLACAGLTEWIADDINDYVLRALTHAAWFQRLARLRQGLRHNVFVSPLFNAQRFAANFEKALGDIWQASCVRRRKQAIDAIRSQ